MRLRKENNMACIYEKMELIAKGLTFAEAFKEYEEIKNREVLD